MSTTKIIWQIVGKELASFLSAKNGKLHKSNPFYLSSSGSAKFQLECYSNGMNEGEQGSVDLFLKILSLPEDASDITLRYSLECIETNTCFSKIKTFNREITSSCWPYNTLQLIELIKLKIATFSVSIQILSILYKKPKSVIGRITKYKLKQIKMQKYTSFTWNITDMEYDNFFHCKNRKIIKSPSFGGYLNEFYQLECYPNGTKLDQRGNVIMCLSLLSLPPLISSVKLFYCFQCIQYDAKWSNIHDFNYKSSVKGWPIGLIKLDTLYKLTNKQRNITFKCNIEILKLYDAENYKILPRDWHRFIIDNTNTIHNFTNRDNSHQHYQHQHHSKTEDMEIKKLKQAIEMMQNDINAMKDNKYNNEYKPKTKTKRETKDKRKQKKRYHLPTKKDDEDNKEFEAVGDQTLNRRSTNNLLSRAMPIQSTTSVTSIEESTINLPHQTSKHWIQYKQSTMSTSEFATSTAAVSTTVTASTSRDAILRNEYKEVKEDKSLAATITVNNLNDTGSIKENYKHCDIWKWFINEVKLRDEDNKKYFDLFMSQGFDTMDGIKQIEMEDLEQIGITKYGHKKKIMYAVEHWSTSSQIIKATSN